jgi:hypothetical protein
MILPSGQEREGSDRQALEAIQMDNVRISTTPSNELPHKPIFYEHDRLSVHARLRLGHTYAPYVGQELYVMNTIIRERKRQLTATISKIHWLSNATA